MDNDYEQPRDSRPPARAWQRMLSGRRLDLLDPSPLDIEIEDIAHGLARVARWNGQTSGPHVFSVAQHSLLVEAIASHLARKDGTEDEGPGGSSSSGLSARWRLFVLLHDAPEYVIGDMISPFKATIGDAYRSVEARLMAAIHLRCGLAAIAPAPLAARIKQADRIAAFLEATALAGFERTEALNIFGSPEPLPRAVHAMLVPCPTAEAEQRFLARFRQLSDA